MSEFRPQHSDSVTEWRMQELMARLDERTTAIQQELKELRGSVVTQQEFKPVRMVVYGLIGIILTSVMGGILAIVLGGAH